MGLNRISNPKALRRLSARVGLPVIRGYARFFMNQNTVLAFTDATTAYVVPKSEGPVERYMDEDVELLDTGLSTRARLPTDVGA